MSPQVRLYFAACLVVGSKLTPLIPYCLLSQYENPYIFIDLKQNSSDKSAGEVDIADVAYYVEKDVSAMGGVFQRLNMYGSAFDGHRILWQKQDKLL